jgi:hypothetical protein
MNMMNSLRRGWLRLAVPGGFVLLLGECGLSDQQLTSIAQTVITTGLNTIVSQTLANIITAGTTAAGG